MNTNCHGQHDARCADCAIARHRRRTPALQARFQPTSFADFWGILGVTAALEARRESQRREQLRRRWQNLPPRYTESPVFRRIVNNASNESIWKLHGTIGQLEEMAYEQ